LKLSIKKLDIIIIAALVVISAVAIVAVSLLRTGDDSAGELTAKIYADGELLYSLPLDIDAEKRIETPSGYNVITVQDGAVRVSSADCSGKQCVHTGAKKHSGDVIACLPHKVLIEVKKAGGSTGTIGESDYYSESFIAMDAPVTLTIYGENAKQAWEDSKKLIESLDLALDSHDADSIIGKLNSSKSALIEDENAKEAIIRGAALSESSGGRFDITIKSVLSLWNIGQPEARIPEAGELADAVRKVGIQNLKIDGKNVELENDAEIDLGGIAKGYAADKVAALLRENGIENALIALSGNIYALGKNEEDGKDWQVGIQDPEHETDYIGVLFLSDISAVTSGGYERYSDLGGKRYHHIFDPKAGYPAESDLASVTIVSKDSALADAYSTALFVMGKEEAVKFQKQNSELFDMILIANDGSVTCSDGLSDKFVLVDESGRYKMESAN
jgi:thiamine biosynthesis lipoprotein